MTTAFPGIRWITTVAAAFSGLLASGAINMAAAGEGQPYEWQIGMQKAYSAVAESMADFHTLLLVIITAIMVFVLLLLVWVMIAYNEKANPKPSKTTHNTTIEVVWTLVPILILLVMAVPSFRILSQQYDYPKSDLVIKAIGHQWYWEYKYPDSGVEFSSVLLEGEDLEKAKAAGEKAPRMLAVDNPVVVPVNKVVYVLVSAPSEGVIHNWTVPAFGVKMDAIPGAVKLVWFKAREEGTYYGQCSEMCGARHAFMPIEVRVVSDEVYAKWQVAVKTDAGQAKAILKQAELDLARKNKSVASLENK